MVNTTGRADLPPKPGARIGLLGGTFDPVHRGHLAVADAAMQRLELDSLIFIPAALNPLKREQDITDFRHRVAMLDLAVQEQPDYFVSIIEGRRLPPSFSIDTVKELRQRLGNDAELFLLLGLDAFSELNRWKEGKSFLKYAHVVVVPRPPFELAELATVVPRVFPGSTYHAQYSEWFVPDNQYRIIPLDLPPTDLSSSSIRLRASLSENLHDQVGDKVAAYIAEHSLYNKAET